MKRHLCVLLLVLTIAPAIGQPGGGGDPGHGKPVPLTGIEFLLAGGVLLGLRRILGRKNRE